MISNNFPQLANDYWTTFFEKAIKNEFEREVQKVVENAEKELKKKLNEISQKLLHNFTNNINLQYRDDPFSLKPQITISFSIFKEEEKDGD